VCRAPENLLSYLDSCGAEASILSGLVLKRGKSSRPSGQWSDEDYDVLADGKVIGRIYEDASASTPPESRWFWSITEIMPSVSNKTNGQSG
jgi:hypothetical protein